MNIRTAVLGDAETIHGALGAFAREGEDAGRFVSTIEDIREHGFGDHPSFEVVLAEAGGQFAGLCLFFPIFSSWMGRPGVYIQDLFVRSQFRGQGVAQSLLRVVAEKASARGACYLRLSVDRTNLGAKTFYDRIGIEASSDEEVRVLRGEAFHAFARGNAAR